jgi:hypothetical protein
MVAAVMLAGTGLGGACHVETAEVIHLGGPARVSPVTYLKKHCPCDQKTEGAIHANKMPGHRPLGAHSCYFAHLAKLVASGAIPSS